MRRARGFVPALAARRCVYLGHDRMLTLRGYRQRIFIFRPGKHGVILLQGDRYGSSVLSVRHSLGNDSDRRLKCRVIAARVLIVRIGAGLCLASSVHASEYKQKLMLDRVA
jgi:hypothetical protein